MEYEHFAADRKSVNALVRSLEVMGEAAKRIPVVKTELPPVKPLIEQALRDLEAR